MKDKKKYDTKYYSNNFAAKFEKLLNSHYSDTKPTQRRVKFLNEYCEMFDDSSLCLSAINQWFSVSLNKHPKLDKLIRICILLECDIDYFLTEQEDFEKDVRQAADTIGLGYTETKIISNLSPEQKEILSILIISQNFGILLKDFANYAHSNLQHGIVIDDSVSEESEHKERKIDGNELRMIRKYDISNKINNILEFLRKCYWNNDLKAGVDALKKQLEDKNDSFIESLKLSGWKENDIKKISSMIPSSDSTLNDLYNELKI